MLAVMTTNVSLLGTSLQLKEGQVVEVTEATNLPQYEDRLYFAKPFSGRWSNGQYCEDDSILVTEYDFTRKDEIMEMHIVEVISGRGVKTSCDSARLKTPKPGDWIFVRDEFRKYPISHRYCRVWTVGDGRVSAVDGSGSCFLCDNGNVDISGGPFFSVPVGELEPLCKLYEGDYWNWGDNLPGADKGVHYKISRPVFMLLCHPYDIQGRIGRTEQDAREGGLFKGYPIPSGATLYAAEPYRGEKGYTEFWFDLRPCKGATE